MRQNWFPLLVWSSSLVPITRSWLIRQQKSILSNSDFASHFKSIHKIRMRQNSEIKILHSKEKSTPLSAPANHVKFPNPKTPRPHTTSSTPTTCKWADLKESIQHGKGGEILLMPHIHKWAVNLLTPHEQTQWSVPSMWESRQRDSGEEPPHTWPVVCPNL